MKEITSIPQDKDLVKIFRATEIFGSFQEAILQALANDASWVTLKKDECLLKQGDLADAMYVLVSGSLQVLITREDGNDVVVSKVKPGEIIGEMQFLTGGKRTATVNAIDNTELIKLRRTVFECLGSNYHEFIRKMNMIIQPRLRHNELTDILPKLFGPLTNEQLKVIENKLEWVQLQREEKLFSQGDPGDSFYILLNGCLAVSIEEKEGKMQVLNYINCGESIGEMSIVTNDVRSANIYATRDSELAKFSKTEFLHLLSKFPKLSIQIMKMLAYRVRRAEMSLKKEKSCAIISIIPINQETPLEEFVQRLIVELSTHGRTLHISSKLLDNYLGTPGISQISKNDPNNIRVSAWMNLQERDNRFIICEADKSMSNWTTRCVKLAEQIVIAGNASSNPALGEIESKLLYRRNEVVPIPNSLILLHPDGNKNPEGTKAWLEKRTVTMHHHVRWDNNFDFQRVARFLAGKAVGLALSGGGARGFAHAGSIKALMEAGVPIDIIGGTSMGAIAAAVHAQGLDGVALVDANKKSVSGVIWDVTFPHTAIFSGKKFVRSLKELFGNIQIEDLWLPFFCVSSNLTNASVGVHRENSLWKGVMASGAAAGIFPPMVIDGDLHVDGGLLSNLPAPEMRNLCEGGTVIAIDVSPPVDLQDNMDYGDGISGWKILWSKINPFAIKISIPDILTILRRAGELSSVSNRKQTINKTADLYILLPVEKYKITDYHLAQEIIEWGYIHTKEKLKNWKPNI